MTCMPITLADIPPPLRCKHNPCIAFTVVRLDLKFVYWCYTPTTRYVSRSSLSIWKSPLIVLSCFAFSPQLPVVQFNATSHPEPMSSVCPYPTDARSDAFRRYSSTNHRPSVRYRSYNMNSLCYITEVATPPPPPATVFSCSRNARHTQRFVKGESNPEHMVYFG